MDRSGGLDRYLLQTPDRLLHSDVGSDLKFRIGLIYKQQWYEEAAQRRREATAAAARLGEGGAGAAAAAAAALPAGAKAQAQQLGLEQQRRPQQAAGPPDK